MSYTSAFKCDVCGKKGYPESDHGDIPKRWIEVEITEWTGAETNAHLCDTCKKAVEVALQKKATK